jgi:hypothetical protein
MLNSNQYLYICQEMMQYATFGKHPDFEAPPAKSLAEWIYENLSPKIISDLKQKIYTVWLWDNYSNSLYEEMQKIESYQYIS